MIFRAVRFSKYTGGCISSGDQGGKVRQNSTNLLEIRFSVIITTA